MRVLFLTWRPSLRRFADLVIQLEKSGHEVRIAYPSSRFQGLPSRLKASSTPVLAYDEVSSDAYGQAIGVLRRTRDYLWYLAPEQEAASFNRRRALRKLITSVADVVGRDVEAWRDPFIQLSPGESRVADAALAEIERRLPPDPAVLEFIGRQDPDVVLVSPLVKQLAHQTEVVKAAKALAIPVGFLVFSWDNLSNKGRVHVAPDRTYVWNEAQKREGIELHGLDPESIVVTGAPHWDGFFELQPAITREELCAAHGFDPVRPIVLFLGSTGRICPKEPLVVDRWLDAVRSGPESLRAANVLIRPHPDERRRWAKWSPRHTGVSRSAVAKPWDQSLFDELHHAAVAVGLNTTAQIEASIVGKPVYTFLAGDDVAPGQRGTLHFYSLLEGRGGVVAYTETLDEHLAQLERGLSGDYDRNAIRRFCEWFVRPRGLDQPVVPLLAEEVLELGKLRQRSPAERFRVPLGEPLSAENPLPLAGGERR